MQIDRHLEGVLHVDLVQHLEDVEGPHLEGVLHGDLVQHLEDTEGLDLVQHLEDTEGLHHHLMA